MTLDVSVGSFVGKMTVSYVLRFWRCMGGVSRLVWEERDGQRRICIADAGPGYMGYGPI